MLANGGDLPGFDIHLQLFQYQVSDAVIRQLDLDHDQLSRPDVEMFADDQQIIDVDDAGDRLENPVLHRHHFELTTDPLAAGDGPGFATTLDGRNQDHAVV